MADDTISVPYNYDLKPLEALLGNVKRPGDFFVRGAFETPMPRFQVEGVGVLSFPVPAAQVRQLIHQATRAPYGRGEATIVDASVRKVWQLTPDKIQISGKSWGKTLERILSDVTNGLGCADSNVTAELYKLLIYDNGGFFKSHRDTEKADGMFGTLVVVMPSAHQGGELIIHHAGREVVVDLASQEISEVTFAAFYADCEHEVKPITQGNRVCLVYNLIQRGTGKTDEPLTAPIYDSEVATATKMLGETFTASGAPAKLAWLLKHHYSPDGLSFAGLKGEDAALVKVLGGAAKLADCAVHLGIVHIEETGPAEPEYDSYYDRHSRWNRYSDEDEEEEEDTSSDSFEVIEVSDVSRFIDQWRDPEDLPIDFGALPLEDGEVLPGRALDDEEPDEQRLTEATGNEGATFERSYHRAALVLWPRARFADVLLQAGVGAALPHLQERVAACGGASGTGAQREPVIAIAESVIEKWEETPAYSSYHSFGKEPNRDEMIRLLCHLGESTLLKRFIGGVVTRQFDGGENEALAGSASILGPAPSARLFTTLVGENMRWFHFACVNLLSRVIRELGERLNNEWRTALSEVAASIVEALPKLKSVSDQHAAEDWLRAEKAKPVNATMLTELLDSLGILDVNRLRSDAVAAMTVNSSVFNPGTVIVPALADMHTSQGEVFASDKECARLWRHAAEFLLVRSENPPAPPTDWRQVVKHSCQCEDCRALQKFARDPDAKTAGFRVRKDRREHLHRQIELCGLDMTHITERKGSPQTLVCTKTRRTYERQCEQHRTDCESMRTLLDVIRKPSEDTAELWTRMAAAKDRTLKG